MGGWSFSCGRALREPALQAWAGKAENEDAARDALGHRSRMNSLATKGEWKSGLEKAA